MKVEVLRVVTSEREMDFPLEGDLVLRADNTADGLLVVQAFNSKKKPSNAPGDRSTVQAVFKDWKYWYMTDIQESKSK